MNYQIQNFYNCQLASPCISKNFFPRLLTQWVRIWNKKYFLVTTLQGPSSSFLVSPLTVPGIIFIFDNTSDSWTLANATTRPPPHNVYSKLRNSSSPRWTTDFSRHVIGVSYAVMRWKFDRIIERSFFFFWVIIK